MVALSVLISVILSITTLTIHSVDINQSNASNLQAMYLAEEGLEAVREIRDSNVLNNYYWLGNEGKFWGKTFEKVDVNGQYFVISANDFVDEQNGPWQVKQVDLDLLTENELKEEDSIFDRYIFIKAISEDEIYVESNVSWLEKNKAKKEVKLFTTLTDWRN